MLQLPTKYKIDNKRTQQKNTIPVTNYRRTSNCISIPQCLLDQNYLSNNILCQAKITLLDDNSETKVCYGICEANVKLQYANHKKSFNQKNHKSDTGLSNKFWKIKNNNQMGAYVRLQKYNTSIKRCYLYLNEKFSVALQRDKNMLNKRTEI